MSRSRADGGTFTATQALELGLIDGVAPLSEVFARTAELAQLTRWRAVRYEEPISWAEWATGVKWQAPPPSWVEALQQASSPRVLYLTPGYEPLFTLTASPTP